MTDDSLDLSGIYDNLTPDDFKLTHGPNRGSQAFTAWVHAMVMETRQTWERMDAHLIPISTVADSKTSLTIVANDVETLAEYTDRVRDAARRLGATWLFTARKTEVGYYATTNVDPDVPDATINEAGAREVAAKHDISLTEGVYYFAARHEGEDLERTHGIIPGDDDGVLGDTVEGDADMQAISLYGDIL